MTACANIPFPLDERRLGSADALIGLDRGRAPCEPREMAPERAKPAEPSRDERLAAMFDAHYDSIWRTLRRLGVDDASADDAAQRVFMVATKNLADILAGGEGRYLYGVALRVASEFRRRNPRRREIFDDGVLLVLTDQAPSPERALEREEARRILDVLLASLSDDHREVLVLVDIEGLTAPEAAEVLAIPLGTATSRLKRARDAFATSLERARHRQRPRSLRARSAP